MADKKQRLKTEDILKRVGASPWMRRQFSIGEVDDDEVRFFRRLMHDFCGEYHISIVDRDFFGYFKALPDRREVWGIYPITMREFFVWLLYATTIIFPQPELERSVQFMEFTYDYYGIDRQEWLELLSEFAEQVNMTVNVNS